MPVIYRYKGYVFFFYSADGREKKHVHVRKADGVAKFWLEPIDLFSSSGFRSSELKEIREIIEDKHEQFLNEWERYFSGQ